MIRNIGRIRNCLSDECSVIIIHVFIVDKIYYCNSLLNISLQFWKKNWLLVRFRIISKILVLINQEYPEVAPGYLCWELISKHHGIKSLRSKSMMLLDEPKIQVKTYIPQSFVDAVPRGWNKIPSNIKKNSTLLDSSKSNLKPWWDEYNPIA